MEHLDLVIWLIGYQFVIILDTYVQYKVRGKHREMNDGTAMMLLLIWVGVGVLIY